MRHIRKFGWLAVLVLTLALAFGGLEAGAGAFRQSLGVRGLLRAGAGLTSEELTNPFVYLREGGNPTKALAALENLSDEYLRGVGLCMAGEDEAGMAVLKEAGGEANAEVQYAAGLSVMDQQEGADLLATAGLANDELVAVVQNLIAQPNVEPYPALRVLLGEQANDKPRTWRLWLQGSSRLEAENEWQRALEWLDEGLAVAPQEMRGSLYLREGRIWQTLSEPKDAQAALKAYNQALEGGGWINPGDEVNAHIYRGEVYRSLKDEFRPEQALEEFNSALRIQPGYYWALMDIGHVYMNDLKDMEKAESYYRQAMAGNEQNPYAYLYIGDVYRARGDNVTAANWYQKALDHQPNWQAALDRLAALEGK